MLSKTENKIMLTLYSECSAKGAVLISPNDFIRIADIENLTATRLDEILSDLNKDGYLDLVYTDRQGETMYCISLSEKGKGFIRERTIIKRNLLYRLGLTVVFAIVSFLIGLILKAIF